MANTDLATLEEQDLLELGISSWEFDSAWLDYDGRMSARPGWWWAT
jgi:hypothetical protein